MEKTEKNLETKVTGLDLLKKANQIESSTSAKNIKWSELSDENFKVLAEVLKLDSYVDSTAWRNIARKNLANFILANENANVLNTLINLGFTNQRLNFYNKLAKMKKTKLIAEIEKIK